ncbi:MAG: Magnesium and cobalt efflux protein CorC [Bacteroidetes bacterium ADurb.Bin302]|jgi:putative hemolysin|nr:MAG: Magnesium and cobalt efflux protein CorC [Bacteroidetes bacterium ADurb.Bin302]HPG54943.1 gliding motility-associated protein GldE [Candidatus Enterocola sp.]
MIVNIVLACVIILLMLCSAFASASEMAYFSLRPKDIEALENRNTPTDQLVLKLRESPDRLLSSILITNNLVNVGIIILISKLMLNLFDFSSRPILAFLVETVLITFILLLFGENMPKIYAANYSLKFVRFAAKPLHIIEKLLYPITWLMVKPAKRVKRFEKHSKQAITINDLSQAFEITSDEISEDKEILEGIIKFGDISAASAMTARVDVIAIDDTATFQEIIDLINTNEYSRMPVFHENIDDIRGILYIKDLLSHINEPNYAWQKLIRKAYFVPQTKHINVLLEDFQKNKTHIAIVVDEFGGTAGIITMEDILEEIVGEIDDEYDDNEQLYARLNENNYLFEAKILLNDFFKIEGINKQDFEKIIGEAETLAGLILELKGEIPVQETEITYKNYHFKIVSADKRRIKSIKLSILPKTEPEDEQEYEEE